MADYRRLRIYQFASQGMHQKERFHDRTRGGSHGFVKTVRGEYPPGFCVKDKSNRRRPSDGMIESTLRILGRWLRP